MGRAYGEPRGARERPPRVPRTVTSAAATEVFAGIVASFTARLSDAAEHGAERARGALSTPGRRTRTAVVLGRLVAVAFAVCFVTGLYSHVLQSPLPWLPLFPQPSWLYRVTQGAHVLTGLALVPLTLGKLWSVYPRLFHWPPITGLRTLLERGAIAVLVSTSLLELVLGVMNIAQWYAFPFSFRRVHFVLAWVVIGSILLHIAVKLPIIVGFWRAHPDGPVEGTPAPPARTWPDALPPDPAQRPTTAETVSRRGALIALGVSTGAVLLTTAGQSIPALAPLAVLSPRRPGIGPQGLPVNRTAAEAGAVDAARSPDWRLTVSGSAATVVLSLADLRALPQVDATLPIACVEGWSQSARWRGVRLGDLLALAGDAAPGDLRITSLQTRGAFAVTRMPAVYVADPTTLVALELNGSVLDIDHGFPARIIAPGRPGVMQTKWLSAIEVET